MRWQSCARPARRRWRRPGLGERLEKSGLEIWDQPPERLTAVMRDDWARWEKVVKSAKLAAE